MAYLHKFPEDSVFRNSIKTAPQYTVVMYSGSMFVNKLRFSGIESSSFAGVLRGTNFGNAYDPALVPSGGINLYELNVGNARAPNADQHDGQTLIRPFIEKSGDYFSFKTVELSGSSWAEADYGQKLYGVYPLTSSITREFISAAGITPNTDWFIDNPDGDGGDGVTAQPSKPFITNADTDNGGYSGGGGLLFFETRKRIIALRNTIDYYNRYSNTLKYSGSYETASVNLISIPSIFFNSGIKKGSVSLKFYVTGTLIDEVQDVRQNGELISVTTTSPATGTVMGHVLYNEGFMMLTGTTTIGSVQDGGFGGDTYEFDGEKQLPKWIYFGAFNSGTMANLAPSASLYDISFRGTNEIPTMTMFAEANAGDVNCSQNPTWISSSMKGWQTDQVQFDKGTFQEPEFMEIKNTIQSDFCNYEENFEKQVFISKIGIFDKDKNLIGVAKLANPIAKKETDDFTFKIKMDF